MTETRIVDPDTGGEKGRKLARFELLPEDALWEVAEHFGKGAEKYEDRNWERGYSWSLSYGALRRHMAAWWQGEDDDADTGDSHLAAMAFHVLALLAFKQRGIGTDDRPKTHNPPYKPFTVGPFYWSDAQREYAAEVTSEAYGMHAALLRAAGVPDGEE